MTHLKRFVCSLMTAALLLGLVPATAFASHTPDPTTDCATIVTQYNYASNEGYTENGSIQRTGTVAYNDEWFMGPASTYNQHLATLSAITSITSASYYPAPDERDHSNNSRYIVELLGNLQFEDVAVNDYYSLEMLPYSAGCALGHKTIKQNGKEYTLLAIIPRSAGYKQEWAGNFTVEGGNLHAGFMAGRDEVLRFTKQYIADTGITGDVKVWTCGHSRGSALANLLGAFFAAGGAEGYLDGVNIAPEDVFSYTYATPTTVMTSGATKGELLSVLAAQSLDPDPRYASDTPGEGITYTKADASTILEPHSSTFDNIHNIAPGYDIITLLPPPDWNYTHFGTYSDLQEGASRDKMLEALGAVDPHAYNQETLYPDNVFSWKTLDLDNLQIVDNPDAGSLTQAEFFAARASGLVATADDTPAYVSTLGQETLVALAGVYGLHEKGVANLELWTGDTTSTVKAVLFAYLDYARERYEAEGITSDENEAAARVIEDIVSYFSGTDVESGGNTTVDRLIYVLSRFVMDRVELQKDEESGDIVDYTINSKAVEELLRLAGDALVNGVPAEYQSIFGINEDMTEDEKRQAVDRFLLTVLDSCASDEENGRSTLYMILSLAKLMGAFDFPIGEIMGEVDGYVNGTNTTTQMVQGLRELLLVEKDDEGNETARYASFAEAADANLRRVFWRAMDIMLGNGHYEPGTSYYDDLVRYGQRVDASAARLRRMILDLLLYEEGVPFCTEGTVRNLTTFIDQAGHIPIAHYNELYIAWMVAKDSAYPAHLHQLEHIEALAPTCTEPGHTEYWRCSECGLYFADDVAQTEIDAQDTQQAALGHEWGEWETVVEPSVGKKGLERRTCKRCGEVEEREIAARDADVYTIIFDPAGGQLDGSTEAVSARYEAGTKITMPLPTRAGYSFRYWKGSEYKAGDSYTVTEDHRFTAVWEKDAQPAPKRKPSVPATGDAHVDSTVAAFAISMTGLAVLVLRKRYLRELAGK